MQALQIYFWLDDNKFCFFANSLLQLWRGDTVSYSSCTLELCVINGTLVTTAV